MTLADELRALASRLPPTEAGLVTTSAWAMDRLTQRLAKALGVAESVVRLSDGLNAGPTQGHTEAVSIAPRGLGRADSADSADWYSTHGWENRDDAHRVTFEGEGA
jgi:hypothetical protein